MPLAALVAVVMSVGVSTALVVNRIDHGTEAAGGGRLTVAAAHAVPSFAMPFAPTGR